ncbi:DNA-directed DNA polymerase [Cellvibrio sp. BR]|uniref:DNA polymerase IV n=1 Tax=unclassified Cellvibrio TaxID=2624793 RepID=UPI0002601881|nr:MULTISPECIES: DNA polymerase IV [unclassified Cellvibrio]EIK44370.1 DNA-directed DNA polymerase [Cellvibrio sp. BR]QEY13891.1 DNA polymerase IV [Cellvibrio sp. KY-YJ-3]
MRKIIHCDADCFFAAIEMRDDPSLARRPIAVGGSSDRRGVISTCNYEARRFGVHSAMPSSTAMRLCPDLLILPHRMDAYREASQQMRNIFYDYTDLIEPLSLDEAFLDVSDCKHHQGSATRIAQEIRARIQREIGITVSAGIAPNKFLAKIASDWNKPNGQFVITPAQVDSFVAQLPVKKIFGVGKAMASKLAELSIFTCADLQKLSVFELSQRFGQMGSRLYKLSRGIDERELTVDRRRKSLSVENTFAKDLQNLPQCLHELPALSQQLAIRLRRVDDDYKIIKLFVKIKFSDFSTTTIERSATGIQPDEFIALCSEAYHRKEQPVRLLGVGVRFIDLREHNHFVQLELFNRSA